MNRVFKHFIHNKTKNIEVVIILSIIMIIQLFLASELWVKVNNDYLNDLSQSCYSFSISELDVNKLNSIIVDYPSEIDKPLDIQLMGSVMDYPGQMISEKVIRENDVKNYFDGEKLITKRIYAPLTELSNKRMSSQRNYNFSNLDDSSLIRLISKNEDVNNFNIGNYVFFAGNNYRVYGEAEIHEVFWNFESSYNYIATVNTILNTADNYEIVFQFEKPLIKSDYLVLRKFMRANFDVTKSRMPFVINDEDSNSTQKLTLALVLCITLCFWLIMEFFWYVLESREKEFRILEICGAPTSYIIKQIVIHLSSLCVISEIIGWTFYSILNANTKLLAIKTISPSFVIINSISFWLIALMVLSINLLKSKINKKQLGLSRTIR